MLTGADEKWPRRRPIRKSQIRHQNSLPSRIYTVDNTCQFCCPLRCNKRLCANVRGNRSERDHMNAVDILDIGAKISSMICFIHEKYSGDVIGYKWCWLDGVPR